MPGDDPRKPKRFSQERVVLFLLTGFSGMLVGAPFLFIGAFLTYAGTAIVLGERSWESIKGLFAGLVCLGFGADFWTRGFFYFTEGRRMRHTNAALEPITDLKDLVFYLRPFYQDEFTSRLGVFWWLHGVPRVFTEEEKLARALKSLIGQPVTIGDPREELAPLGIRRMYADEAWREKVSAALKNCKLVVVNAGFGPGIEWEMSEVVRHVSPVKLVILFDHKSVYEAFCSARAEIFPKPLPRYEGSSRDSGRFVALLRFDRNWNPMLEPIPARSRRNLAAQFIPFRRLKVAFLPVRDQIVECST